MVARSDGALASSLHVALTGVCSAREQRAEVGREDERVRDGAVVVDIERGGDRVEPIVTFLVRRRPLSR